MPLRNPFTRRNDENVRPSTLDIPSANGKQPPKFERVDTTGSSSVQSVSSRKSQDTGEYKMSVVNDSGVYLPPSPTEDKNQWGRRYLPRTSTDNKSDHGEIEHFSISRESFDSYRRSFDISARSPIVNTGEFGRPRQSLDSARFQSLPKSSLQRRRFAQEPATTEEEDLEEVNLQDDADRPTSPQPKKRGFFSKLTDGANHEGNANMTEMKSGANTTTSRFSLLPGRKRGQSGQGAELGSMDRPNTANKTPTSDLERVDTAATVKNS